jgi:hypothetical protein
VRSRMSCSNLHLNLKVGSVIVSTNGIEKNSACLKMK